jgi:hypothetical protein
MESFFGWLLGIVCTDPRGLVQAVLVGVVVAVIATAVL